MCARRKEEPAYVIEGWPAKVKEYRESGLYDDVQLHELAEGLRMAVDVSVYDDPAFDAHQMHMLRLGMQNELDVTALAAARVGWMDMLRDLEERGGGLEHVPMRGKEYRYLDPPKAPTEFDLLPELDVRRDEAAGDLERLITDLPDDLRRYALRALSGPAFGDEMASARASAVTAREIGCRAEAGGPQRGL